jgi:hypothetical protein
MLPFLCSASVHTTVHTTTDNPVSSGLHCLPVNATTHIGIALLD